MGMRLAVAVLITLSAVKVVQFSVPVVAFCALAYGVRVVLVTPIWARLREFREPWPFLTPSAAVNVLCASVCFALDALSFFTSVQLLPLGVALTVYAVTPAMTVWIAAAKDCAVPSRTVLLCTLACTSGALVTYQPWMSNSASGLGYFTALGGAFVEAAMPFFFENLTGLDWKWYDQKQAVATSTAFLVFPLIFLVTFLIDSDVLEIDRNQRLYRHHAFDIVGSASAMAIAGICMGSAYALSVDVVRTSLVGFAEVPISFLLQVLVLQQPTNIHQILGALLVIAGVIPLVLLDDDDDGSDGSSKIMALSLTVDDATTTTASETTPLLPPQR